MDADKTTRVANGSFPVIANLFARKELRGSLQFLKDTLERTYPESIISIDEYSGWFTSEFVFRFKNLPEFGARIIERYYIELEMRNK